MPRTYVSPVFLPEIEDVHLADELRQLLVYMDPSPPPSPQPGNLWFNPDTGELYLYDALVNPLCLTSGEPTNVGGIRFRVNADTLEYSADGGQTWTALSGGSGNPPPTEDVYYILTEDYPRPDLAELGFDQLMVADGANWEFVVNASWAARHSHTSVVTPDGRVWVLGGWNGSTRYNDVWYSANGSSWTQAASAAPWTARFAHASVVTFDGRMWVIGGRDTVDRNDVWYSFNGSSWTQATSSAPWAARYQCAAVLRLGGMIWLMGGWGTTRRNDVWYSADGASWTQATSAAGWAARTNFTSLVTPDNRMWIMGGYTDASPNYLNDVWYSSDGISWTQATSAASWPRRYQHISVLTPDGRMWVLGGYGGAFFNDIWCSIDGFTWTQVASAASWTARAVHTSVTTPGGLVWVLGGYDGTNCRNDAYRTTFVPQTIDAQAVDPAAAPQQLYMYRKAAYVSNGWDWQMATNAAPWTARCGHTAVVTSDGKLWIIGGWNVSIAYNDVWYSTNGSLWAQATSAAGWTARTYHTSTVTPDGRIWVLGGWATGALNDVWYSSNGSSWTQATSAALWTGRVLHTSVTTPDGRIWVIGGGSSVVSGRTPYNDVYYSSNGSTWTQASSAALWTARDGHASIVTPDGRMWVLGGYDGSKRNDVWYSTTGSSWTQATSAALWAGRNLHASPVTPDGRIWVMGGDSGSKLNDVWYSHNGSAWTQATSAASWAPRSHFPAAVTPDGRIWLLGGYSLYNDVWYSPAAKVFI